MKEQLVSSKFTECKYCCGVWDFCQSDSEESSQAPKKHLHSITQDFFDIAVSPEQHSISFLSAFLHLKSLA